MKKIVLAITLATTSIIGFSQDFMQIITIESVVSAGAGRSRMLIDKGDGTVEEVKMKNFFSLVGINFSNIQENNKAISTKISELAKQGWNLQFVTPGTYNHAGELGGGIFITRYLFKKE